MARTAAAKKVAKAASASAAGRGFRVNRNFLFPAAMLLVVLVGLALVLLARDRRTDNIITGNQHWYSSYDFYECDRYLGVFYPAATDADQAIVAEGDGLIHVQPFHGSATSATSSVGGFMAAAGVRITDSSLELPDGRVLRESDAVCAAPDGDGEPGAELRVLRWNNVDAPGAVVFVDDLAGVRLSDNGQVVGFALVHPDLDSADVPLPDTTALREKLDLEPADDGEPAETSEPAAETSEPADFEGPQPDAG